MKILRIISLGILSLALASAQSRNVSLSWVPSNGGVGYNVYRASSPSGPFTTPLNPSALTTTNYVDATAVIGQTYSYVVTVLGPPCPAGGGTTACGQSGFSSPVTVTIPPQPAITVTVTVTIQ
jgi:hypothetical protein